MKKRQVYEVWQNYENVIRSLHLKSIEEQRKDSKKRFFNYLIKLLTILVASFLTTLTFQFLITRNGLFNSGINGIIQVLTTYFFQKHNFNLAYYSNCYYLVVLLVNIIIVSVINWFYPDNLEMNSTAIFYVLFQIFWNTLFKQASLHKYVFSSLSPNAWVSISGSDQTGLSLAFYIVIAIISSMIHTFGYQLIYRAKSTPGGLEIITSTISQNEGGKKSRISIGYLSKLFGIFVIFFVTLFKFIVVENDTDIRRNKLINDINSGLEEHEQIQSWKEASSLVERWISYEETDGQVTSPGALDKKVHSQLSKVFQTRTGVKKLAKPTNIRYYLQSNKELLIHLREVYADSEDKEELAKLRELEKNTYDRNPLGYLKYVTNDEKLWASLVYIFFSSYLINQLFPKNTLVVLTAKISNDGNLEEMLELLKNYNPTYFRAVAWSKKVNSEIYVLNCSMTKWNYQLLSVELRKFGEILISASDESS